MIPKTSLKIGGRARAMLVALALSAAVLGLAPEHTAFAAANTPGQAGDGGPGTVSPGGGTAARPKNGSSPKLCSVTLADGTIVFYLPGETIMMAGVGKVTCGKDGKWHQNRTGTASDEIVNPGGGVYAP